MQRLATPFTMTLCAGLLAGCGGGGGISSGVDGTKTGDELTAQELDQVCEATLDYLEVEVDVTETTCRAAGIAIAVQFSAAGDEGIQEACAAIYEICIENPEVVEGTGNLTCDDTPESAPDCEATVAQYETCMTDAVDARAEVANALPSCDELNEENINQAAQDLEDLGTPPDPPVSCEVVNETCPNALDALYDPPAE